METIINKYHGIVSAKPTICLWYLNCQGKGPNKLYTKDWEEFFKNARIPPLNPVSMANVDPLPLSSCWGGFC